MWCVGRLTAEYRERMAGLCELYTRPHDPHQPGVCGDRKSKQLLASPRADLAVQPGRVRKADYEYERRGTCNIFVAVEPKAGNSLARGVQFLAGFWILPVERLISGF